MESLAIAIDGKHPTAGDTLAAVCAIVSAPTGSIELYLSDAEHGDLSILREYTTGEKITQKISINGQEMLQGKAQEKINEYMGGSSIRKLSPYKFMNMSPKEKLALISEILPSGQSKCMADTVKLSLCMGSEEFCNIVRYGLGKTADELTPEELSSSIKKAELVDKTYFEAAKEYFIPQGNLDDMAYVDMLIGNNKKQINEAQAEITRKTKAVQTYQDNLGTEILSANTNELDDEYDKLQKELIAQKEILAHNKNVEATKERLLKDLDGLAVDPQALAEEIKKQQNIMAGLQEYANEQGSIDAAKQSIERLRERISKAAPSTILAERLKSEILLLSEEINVATEREDSSLVEVREAAASRDVTLSKIKDVEKRQGKIKGKQCPLCMSKIDPEEIKEKCKSELAALNKALAKEQKKFDDATNKLGTITVEISALKKNRSNLESEYYEAKANSMSAEDLEAAEKEIAGYVAAIARLEMRDLYARAKTELSGLESSEAMIAQIKGQLSEAVIKEGASEANVIALQLRMDSLMELRDKVIKATQINALIATEQQEIKAMVDRRTSLKKMASILANEKEKGYWFLAKISQAIIETMGYPAILTSDLLGIDKEGNKISDKYLSGGEKIMFATTFLANIASLATGVKIAEIEASEIDSDNLPKIIKTISESPVDIAILSTHNNTGEIPGVNHIRL